MMKKQLISVLAAVSLVMGAVVTSSVTSTIMRGSLVGTAAAAGSAYVKPTNLSLEVLVNARKVQFPDAKPKMVNGSVLVPIRVVTETLKGKVLSVAGKDIVLQKGDRTVKLAIGSKAAAVNGKAITLNAAPSVYNNRTYVPLRFISEAFGEAVEWDSVNQFVWIGHKNVPSLDSLGKIEDIKPYEKYYEGAESTLTNGNGIKYKKARIITVNDLPFSVGGDLYLRLDRATSFQGKSLFRFSTTNKGSFVGGVVLLRDNGIRSREEITLYRESIGDHRIFYYGVVSKADFQVFGDKNYKSFQLSSVKYYDFGFYGEYKVLLENPWR